jgi:hypothetical protein
MLSHTPAWVFALFAFVLALGVRQLRETRVRPARLLLTPAVAVALSASGVVSAFGARAAPLTAWLVSAAFALGAALWRGRPGVQYEPATRTFRLPGSAAPLALMMGIFFTKYAVTVALTVHPELRHGPLLSTAASALYGGFSGLFAGRALWVLRRQPHAPAFE